MNKFNTYEEFLIWLYNLKRFGMSYSIDNIRKLLEYLGNPHEKLKVVLVTGSGGKGSTTAMISSILENAGYKVGRFIKPHLHRYTERISINSKEISKDRLVEIANYVYKKVEELKLRNEYYPTFFEITTTISILYFIEENVDICVYEVGIGGRYDATNVLNPLVSCITRVYLEHTNILGNTIQEIAWNKVGIARKNGYLINGEENTEALKVIREETEKLNCKLYNVTDIGSNSEIKFKKIKSNLKENLLDYFGLNYNLKNLSISLKGDYQLRNAAVAIGCCEILERIGYNIKENSIIKGLEKVVWPGRLEILNKSNNEIILDCAKDPEAINKLVNFLEENGINEVTCCISISNDKDYKNMLRNLLKIGKLFILSKHKVMKRAIDNVILKDYLKDVNPNINCILIDDVKEAVKLGMDLNKRLLVTGSVFTVAEARAYLLNEEEDKLPVSDPV